MAVKNILLMFLIISVFSVANSAHAEMLEHQTMLDPSTGTIQLPTGFWLKQTEDDSPFWYDVDGTWTVMRQSTSCQVVSRGTSIYQQNLAVNQNFPILAGCQVPGGFWSVRRLYNAHNDFISYKLECFETSSVTINILGSDITIPTYLPTGEIKLMTSNGNWIGTVNLGSEPEPTCS